MSQCKQEWNSNYPSNWPSGRTSASVVAGFYALFHLNTEVPVPFSMNYHKISPNLPSDCKLASPVLLLNASRNFSVLNEPPVMSGAHFHASMGHFRNFVDFGFWSVLRAALETQMLEEPWKSSLQAQTRSRASTHSLAIKPIEVIMSALICGQALSHAKGWWSITNVFNHAEWSTSIWISF